MRFHPYCEIFPLVEGPAFDELVADIRQHGLREDIWTFGGLILDGRNRFLACQKANVQPRFRTYIGSEAQALAWVVSANVHRRHLTTEQRAMAAAKVAVLSRGGDPNTARAALTQAQAAAQFDVSPDSIQRAKKVTERGSKPLQKAVERGDIGLKRAAAVVDLPKAEQLAAAKAPDPEPSEGDGAPDAEEIAASEAALVADQEAMGKLLEADDKLAWAMGEVKRLAGLLRIAEQSRDEAINGKGAMTKLLKVEQRKVERLEKQAKKLEAENESLRERVALMRAA